MRLMISKNHHILKVRLVIALLKFFTQRRTNQEVVLKGYGSIKRTAFHIFLDAKPVFLSPGKNKFLSKKMKKLSELIIPKNTILLSRSGTTGYPVLVGENLSRFAVTDDALRICQGNVPIGYIYSFLASKYGHVLMTKNEYGATVSHLECKAHSKNSDTYSSCATPIRNTRKNYGII